MDASEKEKRFQFEKENFVEEVKEETDLSDEVIVKAETVEIDHGDFPDISEADREEIDRKFNQDVDTVSGVTSTQHLLKE